MPEGDGFSELIRRVRAGDPVAAAELVRTYEPEVRRVVRLRLRLTDPRLRRVLDSTDICQSVLGSFFVRVAAGQFDLNGPDDLLKLLVTMARWKVFTKARYHHAERRDQRRLSSGEAKLAAAASAEASPSRALAGRELLEQVRQNLSAAERYLVDQRSAGRAWADLARELCSTPDALRKQLTRALDRVTAQLGLEEAERA